MPRLKQEVIEQSPRSGQSVPSGLTPSVESILLDGDGVPLRLAVADWAGVEPEAGFWSRWLLALLRFTRPDGSPVFGPRGRDRGRLRRVAASAAKVGDPGLATVAGWWMPEARIEVNGTPTAPPPPSDSRPDRPLAVLRPDWLPRGDLLALDHREPGPSSLVEVASRGQTWLGPTWTSPLGGTRIGAASVTHWTTGAFADSAEWSFQAGRGRVTRTLTLLRGKNLALLAQQDDGLGPDGEIRLGLPDGVEAMPDASTRSLVLSAGRGRPMARLIPIGLPCSPYPTDRGSLTVEGREVVLRHRSGQARRRWLPLLVAWGKAPTAWRTLTVAHQSTATPPEVAFAARVAWGPSDDGLVVYRSLGPAALRCFLGHQTPARFLVGGFNAAGEVRPILKVDA